MATCTCSEDSDSLSRLNSLLCELLQKETENNAFKNSLIQRRVKNLQTGDAFIPRGRISSVPSKIWDEILSEVETRTKEWPIPFTCANPSKDSAAVFHLNRAKAFQHILRKVKKHGKQYGVSSLAKTHRILLNCAYLHFQNRVYDLQQVRALLVLLHMVNLLSCNGYSVVGIIPGEGHWNDDILQFLDIDSLKNIIHNFSIPADPDVTSSCMMRLLQAATDSTHRHRQQHSETNNQDVTKTDSEKPKNSLLLNLRTYLNSSGINSCAVKGFDKNLNLVEVCQSEKPTPILEQVSVLEKCLLSLEKEEACIDSVMHFIPSSQFYYQQQLHLTWKMLSPVPHSLQQFHIEFGPVQRRKGMDKNSTTVDAQTYLRKRQEQMEEAAKMKYGLLGQGAEWGSMMRGLLNACVKFELLRTVSKNVAKVDLLDIKMQPDATIDNQGGPFVMYNCARLAMLFENFRKAVKQGVYPKLPSVSKCDMSTLKLEEEWMLLYNYIEPYPSLVQSTVSLSSDWIRSEMHTHKVVNFLVSLSHCFSSYYSRVHILTEPRPHLLPVMFARLHLMSAVYQVMQNGLHLLDIVPPKQL